MNQSEAVVQLIGIRCAGYRPFNGQPGEVYGGRYYPTLLAQDGSIARNARFVAQFYINKRGQRDAQGQQLRDNDVIPITFWNGSHRTPGKGLGDIAAKSITVGKEITVRCNLRMYDSKVFDGDNPIMKQTGGQLTKRATSFVVRPNSLMWGDDSAKQIANEVQAWQGIINFISRPPNWNTEGHPDNQVWREQIIPFRNGADYLGGNVFGYALVVSDAALGATAGAGLVNPNLTQQVVAAVPTQVQPLQQPVQTVAQPAYIPAAHVVNPNPLAQQTGGQVRV